MKTDELARLSFINTGIKFDETTYEKNNCNFFVGNPGFIILSK